MREFGTQSVATVCSVTGVLSALSATLFPFARRTGTNADALKARWIAETSFHGGAVLVAVTLALVVLVVAVHGDPRTQMTLTSATSALTGWYLYDVTRGYLGWPDRFGHHLVPAAGWFLLLVAVVSFALAASMLAAGELAG